MSTQLTAPQPRVPGEPGAPPHWAGAARTEATRVLAVCAAELGSPPTSWRPFTHAAVGARVRGGSRTGPLRAGVLPHVWPQELRGSRRCPVAVWSRLSFLASGSCPSVLMPRDRAGGDVHRRHHLELTRRPAGVRSGTARCRKVPRAWLTRGLCDQTGPQSTPCSLFKMSSLSQK